MHFRPKFGIGVGQLTYSEHDAELMPGVESDFEETVVQGRFGWEFVFGNHALALEIEGAGTDSGEEEWKWSRRVIQKNELEVWQLGFELGYLASTWDRSLSASELTGGHRYVRFAGGPLFYFRHQEFERDDFFVGGVRRPDLSGVTETFDMVGVELRLDFEVGPRDIVAWFVGGRIGGGALLSQNDYIDDAIGEDVDIWTGSVQGMVETGLVSHFARHLELRAGFRYRCLEVDGEMKEDVRGSGRYYDVELPDNTTELYMGFIEGVIPF